MIARRNISDRISGGREWMGGLGGSEYLAWSSASGKAVCVSRTEDFVVLAPREIQMETIL